ncbi:MAG: DNA-processing protein DprA, partial [Elusimicrobia bacterium]|nr:DNA-processing protein DprA [Elusimicrobiota bacterium]
MSVPSAARDIAGPPAALLENDYPDLLRSLPERPEKLYALGLPPDGTPALALVGSRRPSAYGRRMARALAREAAARGLA